MARQMNYKRPKDLKRTATKLLAYLGNHKFAMFIVAILVILSAGVNLAGTYMLKPTINSFILTKDLTGLMKMAATMGGIYLAGVLCTLGYTQLMVKMAQQIIKEIRSDLFAKTQNLPLRYFDARTHGELMSRFTNDIDVVADALNNSFTAVINNFVMITGTVIIIVVLNWRLSIVVLIAMLLMTLFIQTSGKKSKHYFNKQQKYIGSLNGFIEEMVEGQKVVKVFNHEEKDFEEFTRRNELLRESATEALTYSGIMVPVVVSMSYLNYAISAMIGGFFSIAGLMDLGSLAAYLVYVRQTAMPINQFTQQINFILAAMSGAERIFEMMDEAEEIDQGIVTLVRVCKDENGVMHECDNYTGHWAWRHPHSDGSAELVELKGDVRFKDVVFSYDAGHEILHGINLYAKPGQKIAFVGATGAGKTTITNLINRFYEVDSGSITYDGIDVRLIKKDDLRRSLGMVLQDTHLFTGTIADNIRYGSLYASDEDVIKAAKLANADSFIRRLPDGYQTMLHSDSANLSQGQRQLLAIARAAIADPPVLILDEATSALDNATEILIQGALDELCKGRTTLVVAHRLSTIKNADEIVVITDHGIEERGTHEELLENNKLYTMLYNSQFKTN